MDGQRTAVVYLSYHHHNTRRVAEALADELRADLLAGDTCGPSALEDYDIAGFGSGIYFGRHHRGLRRLIDRAVYVPPKCFIFSTAGLPGLRALWHGSLRHRLRRRGCSILGEFGCAGWDTAGPLVLLGGLNRRRPDDADLARARAFARSILDLPNEDTR